MNRVKSEVLIIGTRGSPLALWQARYVQDNLAKNGYKLDIKIIKTSGDWLPEHGEIVLGNKACFASAIESDLLNGGIDLGVHSMKDMEADLPEGLCIPFMLPREDVRDAFLSLKYKNFNDLPKGAVVGTVSPRRKAYILHHRPDLEVVPLRGNVGTRIEKMKNGQVDATFLAVAGLKRLGLGHEITDIMNTDDMLPAVGQGAIGIEVQIRNLDKLSFISQISCSKTIFCVEVERGVLRALGGSCHTPVGVHACLKGKEMQLRAEILSVDGREKWRQESVKNIDSVENAKLFGESIGKALRAMVPEDVLAVHG